MPFIRLGLFGDLPHGFGTKGTGISELGRFGLSREELLSLHQVHGARVFVARGWPDDPPEADAVVTDRDMALAIWTADCFPILFYDPKREVIGAVHGGWRGILEGIIGETLRVMVEEFGCQKEEVLCGIGPGIGPCCYEVGEEVAEEYRRRFGEGVLQERERRTFLDLRESIRLELRKAGISPERIEEVSLCTHCEGELFYSHRRGEKGRLLNFIALGGRRCSS